MSVPDGGGTPILTCPSCGEALQQGAEDQYFCEHCGAPLAGLRADDPQRRQVPRQGEAAPEGQTLPGPLPAGEQSWPDLEVPDWLQAMAWSQAGGREPAAAPERPPGAEVPSDAQVPDWLQAMGASWESGAGRVVGEESSPGPVAAPEQLATESALARPQDEAPPMAADEADAVPPEAGAPEDAGVPADAGAPEDAIALEDAAVLEDAGVPEWLQEAEAWVVAGRPPLAGAGKPAAARLKEAAESPSGADTLPEWLETPAAPPPAGARVIIEPQTSSSPEQRRQRRTGGAPIAAALILFLIVFALVLAIGLWVIVRGRGL